MSVLRSSREIPATPQAVFAAFQDPTRLARWWGPNGNTNTFHRFEFRDGGSWLFTMHGPLVSWYRVFENSAFAENARRFLETSNEQNMERLAVEVGRVH